MTRLVVNGQAREPGEPLSRRLIGYLRSDLGLTSVKPGCGEGACGACTVLVDGRPALSCQTSLAEVEGCSITTAEGLADGESLHPVQQALAEEVAYQCGYCTPAMVLRAVALLAEDPDPSETRTAEALSPCLCRCGCYPRLVRAVQRAAHAVRAGTPGRRLEPSPEQPRLRRPTRPWDLTEVSERDWFELLGDGLVVVLAPEATTPGMWPAKGGAWLHVSPAGTVTAFSGKVDVGQDNETALRLLVAEELGVGLADVRIVLGDTDVCPFDMGTFGSRSMPDAGEALRRVAAAGRAAIAALLPLGEGSHLRTSAGAAGEGLDTAFLAGQRHVEVVVEEPVLTPPAVWCLAGTPGHGPARLDLVTGRRRYVSDLELPGLLHGAVLRPVVRGSVLAELEVAAAAAMAGVTVVQDGDFVGAVATDPVTARRAVAAMRTTWSEPPEGPVDLEAYLRSHPRTVEGWERAVDDAVGDVEHAYASATVRTAATYTTAYLAHTPLETRAAVADYENGRLTVWTGTQVPFGVRGQLAERLDLEESDVRVIVPPTGGGFGGKHAGDVAVEAARLARAIGKPVKVHWSRAEELVWGSLRPMAVVDVRAGLDREGRLVAWDFLDVNAGPAGIAMPYRVANRRLVYQPAESPLVQGSYRALAATANNFARESHLDELAIASGTDPVELRLRHLDDERLTAVIESAAEGFGWGATAGRPPAATSGPFASEGDGMAAGIEKGGRIATFAHVGIRADGSVAVTRIVSAYECGAIVNPDTVVNQIEGATVMALGGALFEAVPVEIGRVADTSLAHYRLPRATDVPRIEVRLLDRPDLPSAGAGETPLIAVAPALANAVAAASGRRLRALPLVPGDLAHPFASPPS